MNCQRVDRATADLAPGQCRQQRTPMIGQADKCSPPAVVSLLHTALGHEPLPAYDSSGVLHPRHR